MATVFTEEQSDLRRMVREFCEENFQEADVRRLVDTDRGYDLAVWTRMAEELGLQGIAIPDEYGGSGAGQVELNVVIEELGRALAGTPFFASVVLGANLVLAAGDGEAKEELLTGIADGSMIATVAFLEPSARFDVDGISATAVEVDGEWHLSGTKINVLDGLAANVILVAARTRKGISLFRLNADAPGLTIEAQETLDLTRRQAKFILDAAPARLLGAEGCGWEPLAAMLRYASVALCAENAGGALRLVEQSAEYARTREQFGKVIGSYQAIKQKISDVLLDVELARAAAHQTARTADAGDSSLPAEAAMAHALTAEAYVKAAYENIQIHGGTGFTWEHTAHLYFRRAKSNELLFGTPSHHRELAAQHLGV
jgi:alkylation response protein AidB-like acyl-CoA dehydrogenase